jgi:hypothetical protein
MDSTNKNIYLAVTSSYVLLVHYEYLFTCFTFKTIIKLKKIYIFNLLKCFSHLNNRYLCIKGDMNMIFP